MLACVQTGCECAGCLPSWSRDCRGSCDCAAQHHERGSYCRSPAQEEINIQNAKYIFYWMHFAFAPSKYLTLIRLGLFVCIHTSNWFCFSGEPWLIQAVNLVKTALKKNNKTLRASVSPSSEPSAGLAFNQHLWKEGMPEWEGALVAKPHPRTLSPSKAPRAAFTGPGSW